MHNVYAQSYNSLKEIMGYSVEPQLFISLCVPLLFIMHRLHIHDWCRMLIFRDFNVYEMDEMETYSKRVFSNGAYIHEEGSWKNVGQI
jgi:hypothetical protein